MTPRSARPCDRGTRSEGAVLAAVLKLGKMVLVPYGGTSSYDLVIDENGRFVRVQVKTGWLTNGVISFNACSQPQGLIKRSYRGRAGVFAVYSPELDTVYLIPIEAIRSGVQARIRIEPPRNSQRKRIVWAEPFRLTTDSFTESVESDVDPPP